MLEDSGNRERRKVAHLNASKVFMRANSVYCRSLNLALVVSCVHTDIFIPMSSVYLVLLELLQSNCVSCLYYQVYPFTIFFLTRVCIPAFQYRNEATCSHQFLKIENR